MSDPVDQEVEAIKVVLTALTPLSERARVSVLEYVVRRLSIPLTSSSGLPATPSAEGNQPPVQSTAPAPGGQVLSFLPNHDVCLGA